MKGHIKKVKLGFKNEKKNRYLINKKHPITIYNIKDLDKLDKDNIGIIAKIGNKKRLEIIRKAQEKNIELLNINRKYLEKEEKRLKDRKEKREKIKEKRKQGERKSKEKKEEKPAEKEEKKESEKSTVISDTQSDKSEQKSEKTEVTKDKTTDKSKTENKPKKDTKSEIQTNNYDGEEK